MQLYRWFTYIYEIETHECIVSSLPQFLIVQISIKRAMPQVFFNFVTAEILQQFQLSKPVVAFCEVNTFSRIQNIAADLPWLRVGKTMKIPIGLHF